MNDNKKLEIAKQIADELEIAKHAKRLFTKLGYRKSKEPATIEELDAALDYYLKAFRKILEHLS